MAQEVIVEPRRLHPSWLNQLDSGILAEEQLEHYPRFRIRVLVEGDAPLATVTVARGRHVSLAVVALEPSAYGDHAAFDDDTTCLVLTGQATFEVGNERETVCVSTHEGLLVPAGVRYGYRNSGDGLLLMLRGAGRHATTPGYDDFYIGSRPGGTEGISWYRDLWPGEVSDSGPAQRFKLRFPLRTETTPPWRPLARGHSIALHASCLAPTRGEVNLHSHDDEAIWVVLYGEATFWGEADGRYLTTLREHEGILIPRDAHYRYENSGDGYLLMLRYGGRGTPVPML